MKIYRVTNYGNDEQTFFSTLTVAEKELQRRASDKEEFFLIEDEVFASIDEYDAYLKARYHQPE